MKTTTLTPTALTTLNQYLRLPFKNLSLPTPYFINKKNKIRGALRSLIGKGTPEDIVEEALIFSLKEKINLKELNAEQLRHFLASHHLGVDCSGLVFHILDAELKGRKKSPLGRSLTFFPKNFLQKITFFLRPAENASVVIFKNDANSSIIPLKNVQPGDIITISDAGPDHAYQHIILIYQIDYENDLPTTLHYIHSIRLPADGEEHGARTGQIHITDISRPLIQQKWTEKDKTNTDNATLLYITNAHTNELRHLHFLT